MKLTEMEKKTITLYIEDNFKDEIGDPVWVDGYAQDLGITGKQFSGIMSSLSQKGFAYTNGESWGLTNEGIEAAKTL
jgi:hypothetical protein